jgi:hypothetical protein
VVVGLQLLQTASEELGSPRSDLLTTTRRETLLTLMTQEIPTFLSTLISLLNSVAEKQRHTIAPTPPPSPGGSPLRHTTPLLGVVTPPRPSHPHLSPFTTPTQSLLAKSPSSPHPQVPPAYQPFGPLDPILEDVCVGCLTCLSHLFSWMPLSSNITPQVLDTIFYFASLGCESAEDSSDVAGLLGSLAMDCVIELLVKNCVPREFEAFLMKLFDKSFSLLQRLTGVTERGEPINFFHLHERFLGKCSDFFYWFVNSHLKRVEFNPNFPVLEFLALFYKYTFKQPGVDNFCVCLGTWGVFLDHLIMMSSGIHGGQSPPNNNHYERYREILVSMMDSVLKKIQLRHNINELREIDDDTVDDDNETEWQSFLRQSLEYVAKVAKLFPLHAFSQLVPLLESYSSVYLSLAHLISRSGDTATLAIADGPDCEKLHVVLKDLASVLQALGGVSEHFVDEAFTMRLHDAQLLVRKFCIIAKFSTDNLLFNLSTPIPEILSHDFIEMHAQVLGSIQAFSHWLSELYLTSQRTSSQYTDTVTWFASVIVDSAHPLIARDIPEKVVLSACQLLLSLATTVRLKFALSLPGVKELTKKAKDGELGDIPHRAQCMVYRALTNMLVLAWPETSDSQQEWEWRTAELTQVVAGATKVFTELRGTSGWSQEEWLVQQAKSPVRHCLSLLQDLVSSLSAERLKSKQMLFTALSPSLDFIVSLFSTYLHHSEVLAPLMGFFHALFHSMRAQVGPALTEKTIHTFMALLTREHLQEALAEEASLASQVVEKFLSILKLLVSEGTTGNRDLLSSAIQFSLRQIYPIISEKAAPDVKSVLFDLLFQLLLNNWRYFFPHTVLSHMEGEAVDVSLGHREDFFAIMEAFGQSFLQKDIALFKQNLSALETLNKKHKLYSKVQFREHMLHPLLRVLLEALVNKSHNLLQEEICLGVYSMAAVHFPSYHQQFILQYLSSVEGLSDTHRSLLAQQYKMVEDLPSFVLNLQQFVNDLRCYIILSRSVPGGSVSLT